MITITNESTEDFLIEFQLDPNAPGCRVVSVPEPEELPAGLSVKLLGYEPGVSFVMRPKGDATKPRPFMIMNGGF